jgi:hypothetical protein
MADIPDKPTGSDEEHTGATPNEPKQELRELSDNEPTASSESPAQEPRGPRSRRSNEFWVALAGIAATVVVGLTSNWLAYQSSARQLKAESDRVTTSFSRDQRKTAYADYLNAVADLDTAEFNMRNPSPGGALSPVDLEQLNSQFTFYNQAGAKFSQAGSTVRLLASPDVEMARKAIRDKHNKINDQINSLMAAARSVPPHADLVYLRFSIDLDTSPGLEQRFIDAAKKDLGLAG